ncbi:MAG TPA: histidine kinase [Opitutus sp.]|nr:histidine kinase [Opitutus sp.]
MFGLSLLLTFGYSLQRQWRAAAAAQNLHLLLHGWDGWAWMAWPLASPAIVVMIRRFPLVKGRVRRHAAMLALSSLLLYLVVANLRMLLRLLPNLWLPPSADLPLSFNSYLLSIVVVMPLDLLTYCGIFSMTLAIDYFFRSRRRADEALQLQLHASQLESELAQSELKALRGQLHPHFLFNSFNAVATLVRQHRNDAAVEFVAELSMLLRLAIDRTGKQELSLESEIDFVQRYLAIERIRFGEKLQLHFEIDPASLTAMVPNLLLQPLVENAVKHGISRRTEPGVVSVKACRVAERIVIDVENDGPDATAHPAAKEDRPAGGIGLANTRARLERLCDGDYELDMARRADGGMRIHLSLPWKPYDPDQP